MSVNSVSSFWKSPLISAYLIISLAKTLISLQCQSSSLSALFCLNWSVSKYLATVTAHAIIYD